MNSIQKHIPMQKYINTLREINFSKFIQSLLYSFFDSWVTNFTNFGDICENIIVNFIILLIHEIFHHIANS